MIMALRGSLMLCFAVAKSMASSQLGFGIVLVQRRVQRLEHEFSTLADDDTSSRGEPISDTTFMGEHLDELSVAEVDKLLWDGMDIPEDILLRSGLAADERLAKNTQKKASDIYVDVLGLQNTGTNLMVAMLFANFPDIRPGGVHTFGIWKHSYIAAKWRVEPATITAQEELGVVPIMMVRNPMSWLQSMRKAPYELETCVQGSEWLTNQCVHQVPGGYHSDVKATTYDSIQQIWNLWNFAYEEYKTNGYSRGIVVEYEDLVEHPKFVMWQIANYLNMSAPADGWVVVTEAAKKHGDSGGRDEALEKLHSKSYLEAYEPEEETQACEKLYSELQDFYGYTDCSALGH